MKTLSEYHKKVLGLSLKGRASDAGTTPLTKPLPSAGLFCFLCVQKDFEDNKELVLKILKAAGATEDIVVYDPAKADLYGEVFSFAVPKEKALSFESFAEISKRPELKKILWQELKKRL